ncbi:MAG TPA: hypothetical protein VN442_10565, partial [Bryobacteraceae bacterium]|nr:hypothetical protein [Bryobacteraceae bacterium]
EEDEYQKRDQNQNDCHRCVPFVLYQCTALTKAWCFLTVDVSRFQTVACVVKRRTRGGVVFSNRPVAGHHALGESYQRLSLCFGFLYSGVGLLYTLVSSRTPPVDTPR